MVIRNEWDNTCKGHKTHLTGLGFTNFFGPWVLESRESSNLIFSLFIIFCCWWCPLMLSCVATRDLFRCECACPVLLCASSQGAPGQAAAPSGSGCSPHPHPTLSLSHPRREPAAPRDREISLCTDFSCWHTLN